MKRIWIVGLIALMGGITGRGIVFEGTSAYQRRGIAAPAAATQGQEQQPANGTIVGLVRNTVTKEPLDGVNITLTAPNAPRGTTGQVSGVPTTTTDNAGRFTFLNVVPTTYIVRAEREGYFGAPSSAQPTGATAPNQSVVVNAQLTTNVVFELTPGGSIRGRVYDPDGRLSSAVLVNALLETYLDGHIVLSPRGRNVQTDDRGEFRIWGLAPGRYYLRAQSRANARNPQGLTGYYPAELDGARAQVILVSSGRELVADIHLSSTRLLKISGRVVGLDAGLANGIQYQLVPRSPEVWDGTNVLRGAPSRGTGAPASEFELQTSLPGRYEVFAVVRRPAFPGAAAALQAPVLVGRIPVDIIDRDIEGLTLTLRPTFDLQVRFIGNGDPQIGNQILSPISVRSRDVLPSLLSPRNATDDALNAATAGLTGEAYNRARAANAGNPADGTKFSGITEGRYFVDSGLQQLRDAYVADIRQGGKSLYEDGTILVGTEPPAPVEIILARPAGTIQGTVQDSTRKPVPSAQVVLVPDGRRRENPLFYKKATTSADGQFTLPALAPGQYKVFAWENLPSGAERNPQFMARFEQFGRSVSVTAGSMIPNIVVSVVRDPQ